MSDNDTTDLDTAWADVQTLLAPDPLDTGAYHQAVQEARALLGHPTEPTGGGAIVLVLPTKATAPPKPSAIIYDLAAERARRRGQP